MSKERFLASFLHSYEIFHLAFFFFFFDSRRWIFKFLSLSRRNSLSFEVFVEPPQNNSYISLKYLFCQYLVNIAMGFPSSTDGKESGAMQETLVQSLGWEDSLEKRMAIHSSILGWKIPWTREPGRLQSLGSQRARQDWVTNTFTLHSVISYLTINLFFPINTWLYIFNFWV